MFNRRISPTRIAAGVAALFMLAGVAPSPAQATETWFATVVNAPASDPLNARSRPSTSARVVTTFVNGDEVTLNALCQNAVTKKKIDLYGDVFVDDVQKTIRKANWWCRINSGSGLVWVRGRYLRLSLEG